MAKVRRIHLKTGCKKRENLIDFCLNKSQQYVVIGWSSVYGKDSNRFSDYNCFYQAAKGKKTNHALNSFKDAKKGDLFWTRDLAGFYWICQAISEAESYYDEDMDIGARIPVVAFKVGLEVPGQIKASFNRPKGGTIQDFNEEEIINYSKFIYNEKAGSNVYGYVKKEGSVIDNLPDLDLEELIISYLQIKENYYVLSNSIARKSTTVAIECELISRDKDNPQNAVVQVKAKKGHIKYELYKEYTDQKKYKVYLYDGGREAREDDEYEIISRAAVEEFYREYKDILPESITKWEKLFKSNI